MRRPDDTDALAWSRFADALRGGGDPRGGRLTAVLADDRPAMHRPLATIPVRPAWAWLCAWIVDDDAEPSDWPEPKRVEHELITAAAVASPVFARYACPERLDLCTHCYSEDQIASYATTPLPAIAAGPARRLAWEVSDHWPDSLTYRYFLPRILTALSPPESCDVLTDNQFFGCLIDHGFPSWPAAEQVVVRRFATWFRYTRSDDEDAAEWAARLATLG